MANHNGSGMNGQPINQEPTSTLQDKTSQPILANQPDSENAGLSGSVEPEQTGQPDGKVGYGQPPKEHQFKKGESGNPSGRPKGKKNIKSEIKNFLTDMVTVNFGDTEQELSLVAAIVLKQCERALAGNERSAEAIFKRAKDFGVLNDEPPQEGWNDEMIAALTDEELKWLCDVERKKEVIEKRIKKSRGASNSQN